MKKFSQNSLHIIGAGIAGLALGRALARKGISCTIHEKEPKLGVYSSGKNAGMIRIYEGDPVMGWFTRRGTELLFSLQENHPPFLEGTGLFINPVETDYREEGKKNGNTTEKHFERFNLVPGNALVSPDKLLAVLADEVIQGGSRILYNSEFIPSWNKEGLLSGHFSDGCIVEKDAYFILANGSFINAPAFSDFIKGMPVAPYKRHLAEIKMTEQSVQTLFSNAGIWWDELSGCYFRKTLTGIIATHGDQKKTTYNDYSAEQKEKELFVKNFYNAFPEISSASPEITDFRACLRTMATDQYPLIGKIKDRNYFYMIAFGGRGMTCGMAYAELAADMLAEPDNDYWPENVFSPTRFLQES